MKLTEENVKAVAAICRQLAPLVKYQIPSEAWIGLARGVCRFAKDLPTCQILIDTANLKCDTLPSVKDLREMYADKWKPEDTQP